MTTLKRRSVLAGLLSTPLMGAQIVQAAESTDLPVKWDKEYNVIIVGSGGAGLGVPGAEDDAVDARGEDCSGAHGAGFEGDDERAAAQSPRAQGAGGFSQGDDFGVTSGVVVGFAAVPASTDDATVGVDNDGSDGDVSRFTGAICQEQGLAHRFTVLIIHCHPPSLPAKSLLG